MVDKLIELNVIGGVTCNRFGLGIRSQEFSSPDYAHSLEVK